MGSRILFGSMLVLFLLLVMPSISAIQQEIVENGIKQELERNGLSEWIRHPILFILITLLANFRWAHILILLDYATEPRDWPDLFEVVHPYIFLRALWLIGTLEFLVYFWNNLSNKLRWNWPDINPLVD